MRIRTVASLKQFDDLAAVWGDVTGAGGQGSPFASHDWFACCWRTAGPKRRREIWVVEDGPMPVAFVPLLRWRTRRWGVPVRVLSLMESPDTPYVELPIALKPAEVLPVVVEALRARRDWDLLMVPKVPAGSPLLEALESALPGAFTWREAERVQSPCVAIQGSWQEFLRTRSTRFRKTSRHAENRLRRAGAVTVEEHADVDPEGPLFAEVLEVSRQSWKGPRGLAMATMEGMPRFFRELTRRAVARGWLHLWILRVDGRAVATEYQIGSNGTLHALRADFDASMTAASPGASLNLRILEALFTRRSVQEYDMGPGENPYKLRWATGHRETVSLDVYAPTPGGAVQRELEGRVLPALRRLRQLVRRRCA